jgi:virulence-associated protein VagC
LLEQTGLGDEVEISAEGDALVIRPGRPARAGWAAAFQQMARQGDDELLDDEGPTRSDWEDNEWQW